jgi:transketolase
VTTGPLGQGFANGVGMALAGRLTRARFARDGAGPGHHFVYGIVSDGDLMEGVAAEAGSLAGHLGLGNLIYLYDDNEITIDGPTSLSFSEDVAKRFEAYGWHVQAVDGQDWEGVRRSLEVARAEVDRPSLIVTRTTIGYGAPNRAGTSKAHGEKLGAEEVKLTKEALGWPLEPTFLVPQDVRGYLKRRSDAKRAERAAADLELGKWRTANPELADAWDAARERRLPADLDATLAADLAGVDNPTRKHSAVVLERLVECAPYFIGGSADLAGSAAPPILKQQGVVGPGAAERSDPFAGANIHFGVREHAMGAITNGFALDGTLRPFCGTFLIFSDYMRPSIRLAALMGLPSIFVFTHDSIFLGEDGPTHQPIEQLDSLRAIPGLYVFRPADGIETAMAWAWIARYDGGPTLLALSRQKVVAFERTAPFEPEQVWRGAYAVEDSGDAPQAVLVATGSEVQLSTEAARLLRGDGLVVRVVSAPCLELFFEQDEEYQRAVIPNDGTPVIAVEAARAESLRRLMGRNGLLYGIDRFGASAPLADLAREYGFTPDQLADRVHSHLREVSS